MIVRCLRCKARLDIPDARADNPALKLKCPGCGLVFPLGKALRVTAVGQPAAAAAAGAGVDAVAGETAPARPDPGVAPAPPTSTASLASCARHPLVRATVACIRCDRGWCSECGQKVATALLCPQCEGLTVPVFKVEEARAAARRRATPLIEQLGEIANYPFRNLFAFGLAYVVIVCLTIAAFNPLTGALMFLTRESLVVALSLMCIIQVANAKPTFEFMNVENRADLFGILLLGLSVLIVLHGPRILWAFVMDPGPITSAVSWILLGWAVVYAPMAFICAAVSRSMLDTLQPWLGVGAIQRMGGVYWQAAGIYIAAQVALLAAAALAFSAPTIFEVMGKEMSSSGLIVRVLFLIWLEVYLAFAGGALLGHAVDKRAVELELE